MSEPTKLVPAHAYDGCPSCLKYAYQSPTTLNTAHIKPAADAFKPGAEWAATLGDAATLRASLEGVATGELKAPQPDFSKLGESIAFTLNHAGFAPAREAIKGAAEHLFKDKDILAVLTDEVLLSGLNRDLVHTLFRRPEPATPDEETGKAQTRLRKDFLDAAKAKGLGEFLNGLNPFHNPTKETKEALDASDDAIGDNERATLGSRPALLKATRRYLQRSLFTPDSFEHDELGENRLEIATYLLPRLLEHLYDEKFLENMPVDKRKTFLAARDKISAQLAAHLDEKTFALLQDPLAFDPQIIGHEPGALSIDEKVYEAEDTYGKATGYQAIITPEGEAPKADVRVRGEDFAAKHIHWHVGGSEHHHFGEDRNIKGEVHIVHANKDGDQFLVLGAYIEVAEGAHNDMVQAIIDRHEAQFGTAEPKAEPAPEGAEASPQTPAKQSYLDILGGKKAWQEAKLDFYNGTLTTEPYTSGVSFYLSRDKTVVISPKQYAALEEMMQFDGHNRTNSREEQPNMGRPVSSTAAIPAVDAALQQQAAVITPTTPHAAAHG